jgi:hypothetical protein
MRRFAPVLFAAAIRRYYRCSNGNNFRISKRKAKACRELTIAVLRACKVQRSRVPKRGMNYKVQMIFPLLLLLGSCDAQPADNDTCPVQNAARCSNDGTLVKVCQDSTHPPMAPAYRWQDAPAPPFPAASCGCAPDPITGAPSAWCTTVQVDQGTLCVTPTSDLTKGGALVADQPINIHVQRPSCLSGSCSRHLVASCAVKRDGNVLHVTSYFAASEALSATCTADCVTPSADCVTEPLPAGAYTLVLGNETVPLTVPNTIPDNPCIQWLAK